MNSVEKSLNTVADTAEIAPNNDFWARIASHVVADPDYQNRVYADWTASGRLFKPIEDRISNMVGGLMANTHTEDSYTGRVMTTWLHEAEQVIKQHVNASSEDILLNVGSGMTGALAKLIRMMGWWCHEQHRSIVLENMGQKPLVYITHREHHSNHTMWIESLVELRIIPALEGDEIDLEWLEKDLFNEKNRKIKMASITAASNVTGIETPYRRIAKIMHEHKAYCFVDFAASAPYVDIDMHPNDEEWLDAIFFSPHKFLGGPGSSGVLIFNKALYQNKVPEQPGGGTVLWTNPWGEHRFISNIEQRESGGTPGILQTIKTAMAVQLKEEMGTKNIYEREQYLNALLFNRIDKIDGVRVLSDNHKHRLSIFSIVFENVDYKTAVQRLSNDFHVETRGGCACAGTYGHHLLNIDYCTSKSITDQLDDEFQSLKPGWVRVSLHPCMSESEINTIADAIENVANGANAMFAAPEKTQSIWAPLI
jgi:selenocysteine lyase/cysteine desulfurase